MNKQEFLEALREALRGLPQEDISACLNHYIQRIEDRVAEGYTEEGAVKELPDVREIAAQTLAEIPLSKLIARKKRAGQQWSAGKRALFVLALPLWLPLLVLAAALYIALWCIVSPLWAVPAALGTGALAGVVALILYTVIGTPLAGVALLGLGLSCTGLAILAVYACRAATNAALYLTRSLIVAFKSRFLVQERHAQAETEVQA